MDWILVDYVTAEHVFHPKLKFQNVKAMEQLKEYSPIDDNYYWFQNSTGRFEYSMILRAKIFCPFDFSDFPFDEHECNFTFNARLSTGLIKLTPPMILHKGKTTFYGQDDLEVESKRLPFITKLTGLNSFSLVDETNGYPYDATGMKIHFSRKSLGILTGTFYGPTAIFAVLSMISFQINPNVVLFNIYFFKC